MVIKIINIYNLVKEQMNQNNKSGQVNRPQAYKLSSLTQQCLASLRKGTSSPKTHLLGFMSQYIQDEEEIKLQQIDELCCYDRMKKLLIKNQDSREQRKEQQGTLLKAMQIQTKMNQLQRNLQHKLLNKSRSSGSSLLKNRGKNDQKSRTQHFSFKSTMVENLKQKGYEKFFQFQKIKEQTNINKIKSVIGQQVQSKFKKVLNEKDTQHRKFTDQNKLLQRRILQKNVQLQTLRSQNSHLNQYIKQLQQKLFGVNNQVQNAHLIKSYQKWLNQYKQQFGQMSIKQLGVYVDDIKSKCLEKFNQVENRNQEKLAQIYKLSQDKVMKLRKQVDKLERRENQLIEANRNFKLNKQVSEIQINELLRGKDELMALRHLILSLYNQWHSQRTQNQKSLMQKFGKLKQNYSYEQMLNYIVFYTNKLSTNDKLNDYILKVLRGIQKIRRLIFPMQSNEKLDPFIVMQKIEAWVVRKLRDKQQGVVNHTQKNSKGTVNLEDRQKDNQFLIDQL